jgi:hypothetical protein
MGVSRSRISEWQDVMGCTSRRDPVYMAPERCRRWASAAEDQFSLARVVGNALSRAAVAVEHSKIVGSSRPASAPAGGRSHAAHAVLRRGLAVDPRQRHEDMGALADVLTRVLLDAGRREDRRWTLAAVVTAVTIILALAWLVTRLL